MNDGENKVKLIIGKLNGSNINNFWITELKDLNVGDYAIVENINDYDLVKIVGIVETKEEYLNILTHSKKNKKVVCVISKDNLVELAEINN